MLENNQK